MNCRRFSFPCSVAVFCFTWMHLGICTAAPKPVPSYDDPALLVVIVPNYQYHPQLEAEEVIGPALDYAETFAQGRYHVRIALGVTDLELVPSQAQQVLQRVEAINQRIRQENRNRTVAWQKLHEIECSGHEFTSSEQAYHRIEAWMDHAFGGTKRAAFARMAFRGHGEWRQSIKTQDRDVRSHGDFLLAPDDRADGTGGVSLNWLCTEAFNRRIVGHVDWDMCRSDKVVDGFIRQRPNAPYLDSPRQLVAVGELSLAARAAQLRLNKSYILDTAYQPCNVLFTVHGGAPVESKAKKSLLSVISTGLNSQDFRTSSSPLTLKSPPIDRAAERLLDANSHEIMVYAHGELAKRTDYTTSMEQWPGPIHRQLVVYSREADHLYESPLHNLLVGARPLSTGFLQGEVREDELVITRKGVQLSPQRYVALTLNPASPTQIGFPMTDKKRWVELLVRVTSAPKGMTFCVQLQKNASVPVTMEGAKKHTVPGNGRIYKVVVSLEPQSSTSGLDRQSEFLQFLGISTVILSDSSTVEYQKQLLDNHWPVGGELHLMNCRILDEDPKYRTPIPVNWDRTWPFELSETRNIVPYWWADSILRDAPTLQLERQFREGDQLKIGVRLLSGKPLKPYGWGIEGAVVPSFRVKDSEHLSVSLRRGTLLESSQPGKVGILAYSANSVLGEWEVMMEDEHKSVDLPFQNSGVLRSLSLIVEGTDQVVLESAILIGKSSQ